MLAASPADPVGLRVFGSGDSIALAGAIDEPHPLYLCHLAPCLHR